MGQGREAHVLYQLLDEAGVDYNLEDFNSRLRMQKAVYLMHATGANLGYDFNWYLRGPYSPDLARELFAGQQDVEATRARAASLTMTPQAQKKLDALRAELAQGPVGISKTTWFEALASAAFLRRHGKSNGVIKQRLLNEKGMGPALVGAALASLNRLGVQASTDG